MRLITSFGGKDHLVKGLKAACENIKNDAEEIIGNPDHTTSITVEININAGETMQYKVHRVKAAWLMEDD